MLDVNEQRTSIDTTRRWIDALVTLHLGFLIRPWFRNVSRSLRKEPKWFLRDWASVKDPGDKAETFVACHLLKAVDGWNDMGLGQFGSVVVQKFIEMITRRVHPGCLDGIGNLGRQIIKVVDVPLKGSQAF